MSIKIGSYEFEGPYTSTSSLQDRAGIYAILTLSWSNKYEVVDIGEQCNLFSVTFVNLDHHAPHGPEGLPKGRVARRAG